MSNITENAIVLHKFENFNYMLVIYNAGDKLMNITLDPEHEPQLVLLGKYTYLMYLNPTVDTHNKRLPREAWAIVLMPIKWVVKIIVAPEYKEERIVEAKI